MKKIKSKAAVLLCNKKGMEMVQVAILVAIAVAAGIIKLIRFFRRRLHRVLGRSVAGIAMAFP